MWWIINTVFACLLAGFAHELGHFLCGRAVGLKTRFSVAWREVCGVKYPNPIVSFDEDATNEQMRAFGVGGGGCEFLTLAVLVLIGTRYAAFLASGFVAVFAVVAAVHFLTYPLRNHGREDNDFRYLV